MNDDASAQPPVELEAFRAAMREAGVEEIVEMTLATFLEEAPERMAQLEAAVASADAENIAGAAHGLKSSAGAIRADTFAESLNQMEDAGKSGDLSGAADLLDRLSSEYEAVTGYLKAQNM